MEQWNENRSWMYNRNNPGRRGLRKQFIDGVGEFVNKAQMLPEYLREGNIKCPCLDCKCCAVRNLKEVVMHLYTKGFMPNYFVWTAHGEFDHTVNVDNVFVGASSSNVENDSHNNQMHEMINDAFGMFHEEPSQPNLGPNPNNEAKHFYEELEMASRPFYEGSTHSKLSVSVRLLSIKSDYNISQAGMDEIIGLMNELNPTNLGIPRSYYDTKKLVSKLGLSAERIHCCRKGCMLFYKEDKDRVDCRFCGEARYKPRKNEKDKEVPFKAMHYLPLIPRLKRLYASMSSAPHMRWHHERTKQPGILCHPSDGDAWKHFDSVYPVFASEPRNIRLGLSSDGFTPFAVSATPYSCWPVFVTPYNLPPELCMTSPYIFLTCIIPGPHNPKGGIDVFLQPLIDELQILWNEGVETYDCSLKENFTLHASLMWTINDFPAYGMLSGWSTAGKFSCPCCMEDTKSFYLKNGGKHDQRGRLIVRPDGRHGFIPSDEATPLVVDSMHPHFLQAWSSFGKIPGDVRGKMFDTFKTKVTWSSEYPDYIMQQCFERRAAARLSSSFFNARLTGKKPEWVYEDAWNLLLAYWETDEFKALQEQAKVARASERGGSLHTGGSVSLATHRYRLELANGGPMSDIEFFEKFHVLYDENGNVIGYVEKRAEETITNFRAAEEQWKESQGSDAGSTQPTQEEVTSMFVEASGGYNKGRVYGCGPKQYKKPSRVGISASSSSSSSHVNNEEMREELERLRRAEALNTAKIQKLESFMAEYLRRNGDGNGPGSSQ